MPYDRDRANTPTTVPRSRLKLLAPTLQNDQYVSLNKEF